MQCRRRHPDSFVRGFTLIEVLVVVVILAIAAAAVIPRLGSLGSVQATSAARMLVADLQYAQNEAVVAQKQVSVVFGIGDSSGYRLEDDDGTLTHPINKDVYTVLYAQSADLENVRVDSANFGGSGTLTFDALGAPLAGGSVTLTAGESSYRIDVSPVTGKVTATQLN